MIVLGILCYAAVSVLQLIKIGKIPKSDALKNVE
jgi:putative ABC transport system permease protein